MATFLTAAQIQQERRDADVEMSNARSWVDPLTAIVGLERAITHLERIAAHNRAAAREA